MGFKLVFTTHGIMETLSEFGLGISLAAAML
jgi:hypothetical protein